MKILFVGVLDVNWSTNCSMKRALEDLGHIVVPFNYRTIANDSNFSPIFSSVLLDKWVDKTASFLRSNWPPLNLTWYYNRKNRRQMNDILLRKVKKDNFDLVLLCKTDTVNYNLLPQINKHSPTWYFFMDPIEQVRRINAKKYAAKATWASATFSDVTDYFKKAGARSYWITQGVDPFIFVPKDIPKIYDVIFVGTKNPKRFYYINALRKNRIRATCFGQGWENPPIYQKELSDLYNKSRIILNFCARGSGFSIRVFQVMGAGGFLLSEFRPDLQYFFKQGEHLDWFCNKDEMLSKVNYYLAKDSLREKIAGQGCAFVHKNHSWSAVMQKILNIINVS
jgi:glycosyltransferase involved in cell wall biosynthesis